MEKMKEQKEPKSKKSLIPSISGSLLLSQDKKRVEVDLKLRVFDIQFIYTGDSYVVEHNNFKGIAFSYYHTGDASICDNKPITTGTPEISIKDTIVDSAFLNWNNEGNEEKIRVLLLNEVDKQQFTDMRPYFEKYLEDFEYKDVSMSDFIDFNDTWNNNNPGMQVNNNCLKEDILIPRFTKDGGVLTLKFRR